MKRKIKKVVFTLVFFGTLYFSVFAIARDVEISISMNRQNSIYQLIANFKSQVSPEKVWGILTGYEQFPSFIHQIVTSKIISKDGKKMWLYQEGQETVFFFINLRFRVLLEITELPFEKIEFHDRSNQDFSIFS